MRTNTPLLLVTIGCSGSGKSYLKDRLETYFGTESFENVEPDDLRRTLLGSVNDQSKGRMIFDLAYENIKDGLADNKIVYFNATNTSWSRLQKATDVDCEVIYIFMMDSENVELCQSRVRKDLENEKDRSNVPMDVIVNQCIKFSACLRDARNTEETIFEFDGKNLKELISFIEKRVN